MLLRLEQGHLPLDKKRRGRKLQEETYEREETRYTQNSRRMGNKKKCMYKSGVGRGTKLKLELHLHMLEPLPTLMKISVLYLYR